MNTYALTRMHRTVGLRYLEHSGVLNLYRTNGWTYTKSEQGILYLVRTCSCGYESIGQLITARYCAYTGNDIYYTRNEARNPRCYTDQLEDGLDLISTPPCLYTVRGWLNIAVKRRLI
jgi:hypothetical protein